MITNEPLVEVAVPQFRDRARGFLLPVHVSRFGVHQASEEEPSKSKTLPLRNEALLNCVSLRSSLHCGGSGELSRVEMNALRGALDSSSDPDRRSVSNFVLDTADDFIDGVISDCVNCILANRSKITSNGRVSETNALGCAFGLSACCGSALPTVPHYAAE